MTEPRAALLAALRHVVGRRHVLTGAAAERRYARGWRVGGGPVVAVVRPGSLVEQWRAARLCVEADVAIIVQAANTGLTGGSTPDGAEYPPGGVVIINVMRLSGVHLLDGGRQVVCLPGATLDALERRLAPLGRDPHSVIGSSCLGASVLGGVCNNSGGSLVQRGPAYTECALFARVTAAGELELVNHLGIRLGDDPEAALRRAERGGWAAADVGEGGRASDGSYPAHVRAIDAATPARFNADPRRLFEASGSAGKLILFAVRLDTYPKGGATTTFYIGANDPADLTAIRRAMLGGFQHLPVAAEYMHRTAFDIADRYGKDTVLAIRRLGTGRLPRLFGAKARVDSWTARLGQWGEGLSDRAMQRAGSLFGDHLPPRLRAWRDRYEHHLLLKMAGGGVEEARTYLSGLLPTATAAMFECTAAEEGAAFLHRFAAAGAAVRYRAVHRREVADIVALDVALPRNARDWVETLPAELDGPVTHALYYGHFFCHVFHQDYIVARGADPAAVEHRLHELQDARGGVYPAEHNVGHVYQATPELAGFYRELDPRNQLNPGVGRASKRRFYAQG